VCVRVCVYASVLSRTHLVFGFCTAANAEPGAHACACVCVYTSVLSRTHFVFGCCTAANAEPGARTCACMYVCMHLCFHVHTLHLAAALLLLQSQVRTRVRACVSICAFTYTCALCRVAH